MVGVREQRSDGEKAEYKEGGGGETDCAVKRSVLMTAWHSDVP
jgi:hypothetical protein